MKDISNGVEATEAEAERIIEEAKSRAKEILLKAREEAKEILTSQLVMEEVKSECDRIVAKAKAEAEEKIKDSGQETSKISANAGKKVDEVAERIVNIVIGAKLA